MLAYLIKNRNEIDTIPKSTKAVAFSFRPSMVDLITTMNKGKQIKTIMIADSYLKTIAKSIQMMLKNSGIELKETPVDLRGTRTDLDGKMVEIKDAE